MKLIFSLTFFFFVQGLHHSQNWI